MQKHKKLSARILSMVLSFTMMTTMLPANVFAAEGDAALGASSIGTIQSFDKLEDRFIPSVGKNAPSHVYGLSVSLNTPVEDLNLPTDLMAMVERTTTAAQETIPVTWNSDKEYNSDASGQFIYTAKISEDYILAAGVNLTQIYVAVGKQERATASGISIQVNGTSDTYSGNTLAEAITSSSVAAAAITSLKITAGKVTEDDWNYLKSLTALTTFEIDSTVTEVANIPDAGAGETIFPKSIVSVTVPQAITIGNAVFLDCKALTSVSFPQATEIGGNAFKNCEALMSASFPMADGIYKQTFAYCEALTSASFPRATFIVLGAFYDCTQLATLKLRATPPINVNTAVFENCPTTRSLVFVNSDGTELTGTALTEAQTAYKAFNDGTTTDNLWYGWTIVGNAPAGKITVTAKINNTDTNLSGDTLTAILNANKTKITELKITAGKVTEDDWNYLKNLTALTTFEIDSTVTEVENIPATLNFDYPIFSKSIVSVTVPQAITIGNHALRELSALTSASFPAVTAIGKYAFYGCAALTSASFPQAITIGEAAFMDCAALTSASFPQATTISKQAFRDCKALTSASFSLAITIDDSAFSGCSALTSASFPAVTTINSAAFKDCAALTSASFPQATTINGPAFSGCSALTSASFPAVTNIATNAFMNCTKLATLKLGTIPPTTVGFNAFLNCPTTRSLEIPAAVQANYKAINDDNTTDNLWYGWTIVGNAPAGKITVTAKINNTDTNLSGDTLSAILDANKAAITELKITVGKVTEDDWKYLKSLTALTTFEIDSTVTDVANIPDAQGEESIFSNSIVSVTVPQAITIGNYAFAYCEALTSASIPQATTIGIQAFVACSTLTNPSFPQATTIGKEAFAFCEALTSASIPQATTIGKGAFVECSALTSASIPQATTIGEGAFTFCYALTSASIPQATTIGMQAFYTCTKLATLKLGTTPPPTVGEQAFENCPISRSLVFVDSDDTELTDTALTEAQTAYKAFDDDNTTDNLWYGWTIMAASGGSAPRPTKPATGSINANAAVDDKGNANVNVTEKNIADAVKAAKDAANKNGMNAGEITAIIHISAGSKEVNKVMVNLPKNVQEQIIKNNITNFAVLIDKPDISIGMNLSAMKEMNKQAGEDIQLSAVRTDASALSKEAKTAIGSRPVFEIKATYANGTKNIKNFGSGTVTVSIPYTLKEGEAAGGLYAIYVDEAGNVTYLTNSTYDATAKKDERMVRFATNHFSIYGIGYKTPIGFTDIKNHWGKTDIEHVVNRGLLSGTSKTKFAPKKAITRADFVTALGKLAGVDISKYSTSKFTDVKAGASYAPYVNWAVENGILSAASPSTFEPNGTITRQELALIMSKYAKLCGYKVPETNAEVKFADQEKIAAWAATSVKQMQMAGILKGNKENQMDPYGKVTRAAAAAVLHRYIEQVNVRTNSGLETR